MNLDAEDIAAMRKGGVKVVVKTTPPPPDKSKSSSSAKTEIDYLKEISLRLAMIASKPNPKIDVPPAHVTVKPPEVTVNNPEQEPRIKKWKFSITRDSEGLAKEIIATAMS